jgi:dethiobiotin synthetase
MNGIFITGADTDVGKTWFSVALIRSLRKSVTRVGAYKPVASGVTDGSDSDANRLWEATGQLESLKLVCPQSFVAPLAPPLAASLEARQVDESLLWTGVGAWSERCDFLVVEGAGGLLSPLTFETTNADLAVKLGWPIAIVVANRLGAVNQALMTYEVAMSRKLEVAAIVLNEVSHQAASLHTRQNASMIRQQMLAAKRVVPPLIEFSHGQRELSDAEASNYFGSRL